MKIIPTRRSHLLGTAFLAAHGLLAALLLLPTLALAQATDALPSWNDGAPSRPSSTSLQRVTTAGSPDFVPPRRAHRHLRQRRHAVVPRSRCTSRSCSPSTASRRWRRSTRNGRTTQPFKSVLDGRHRRRSLAGGEKGSARDRGGHTRRHDRPRSSTQIVADWLATAQPSALQPALHRAASTSRCSSCWPTCAPTASRPSSSPAAASTSCGLGPRKRLRHPARAGGRLLGQDQVRDRATASRC